VVVVALAGCGGGDRISEQAGLFFGRTPPGTIPEVFGPGVVSGSGERLHGALAFSPDLREVYWPVVPPRILTVSCVGTEWSDPRPGPIPSGSAQAPSFSPDGRRLFFQANLPGGHGSLDIWYLQHSDTGWAGPYNLAPPVNTARLESQPSVAADGTLYFTGFLPGVAFERGIFRTERRGDGYIEPVLLGPSINSPFIDYTPFIDPQQRFLLFASSRPSTSEDSLDLRVSFRSRDGTFGVARNLSEALRFERAARFPSLSPDGRYLFFQSGDSAYWVDAGVIWDLSPKAAGERHR
jgi:Tol biopolymer transport system component